MSSKTSVHDSDATPLRREVQAFGPTDISLRHVVVDVPANGCPCDGIPDRTNERRQSPYMEPELHVVLCLLSRSLLLSFPSCRFRVPLCTEEICRGQAMVEKKRWNLDMTCLARSYPLPERCLSVTAIQQLPLVSKNGTSTEVLRLLPHGAHPWDRQAPPTSRPLVDPRS